MLQKHFAKLAQLALAVVGTGGLAVGFGGQASAAVTVTDAGQNSHVSIQETVTRQSSSTTTFTSSTPTSGGAVGVSDSDGSNGGNAGGSGTASTGLLSNTTKNDASMGTKLSDSETGGANTEAPKSSAGVAGQGEATDGTAKPSNNAAAVATIPTDRNHLSETDRSVVYVGSQALLIRPTIMARSEFPGDIVASLPVAVSHDAGKTPPHPNGLLSEFTSKLASVVVPGFVVLGAGATGVDQRALADLLALIFLTLQVVVSSYGLWLRRTGYSHAARSDMAAAFTFATPQRMSYDRVLATHPGIAYFYGVRQQKIRDLSRNDTQKGGE